MARTIMCTTAPPCARSVTRRRSASALCAAAALCGESGEAIDIVKKWLMQGHDLDKEHLIKELGDIAWYLAEAATALDVPLETVFQENLDKLRRRFPNGFDTQASAHRKKDDI